LRLLGFANELDIIICIVNASTVLKKTARKVGLKINASKTMIMEPIDSVIDPQQREDLTFEKVETFKYLSAALSTRSD